MDDRILEFSRQRLRGRPVPDDLATLLKAQWSGDSGPLDDLEVEFFASGQSHPLIDHGYLNDKDRADPDIVANVAAIDEVNGHVDYVAEGLDGAVLGYWCHPDEPGGQRPPVVRLDTEGQFEILSGTTFAEAIVGAWVGDDDEWFGRLAERFAALGVAMPVRRRADLIRPDVAVDPAELHKRAYYQHRSP